MNSNWQPFHLFILSSSDISTSNTGSAPQLSRRALTYLFEQARSRIACLKWNDANFGADLLQKCALFFVECFRGVVASFHINSRVACGNKLRRSQFGKNCNEIYAL